MAKKILANMIHTSCKIDWEMGKLWGSWYPQLASFARKLGWDGLGSFWGLCEFANIAQNTQDEGAGPDRDEKINQVAKQIKNRLNRLAKQTKPTIKKNVTLH